MSDSNRDLPDGWICTTIGDVATLVTGKTPSTKKKEYYGGDVPFVKPGDLGVEAHLSKTKSNVTKLGATKAPYLPTSTVLVSCIGNLGKTSILARDAICNQQINGILPTDVLDSNYIYQWAKTIRSWMEENASATTVTILNKSRFERAPIRVPPLNEQKRIVKRIESLQARSQRAREALAEVGPLLEQFRQSVLAAAFRGDLTADWRAENPDVEPASVLLDRIRQERREKWEATELAKYEAKDKQPPKNWQQKYKEPTKDELNEYYKKEKSLRRETQCSHVDIPFKHSIYAPGNWSRNDLLEVCDIIGGSQPAKSKFSDKQNPGYIRLIQIRDYKSDKHIVYIPQKEARRFCSSDDIMIGRYGPPIFQILRGLEGAYNVALMKAVPNESIILKEFLYYFLQSPLIQRYVEADSKRTAGQSGVNKKKLAEYPIYLPERAEQAEIISRLKLKLKSIDIIQENIKQSLDMVTQLDQSILSKAFRGELVPQDPNDEPAAELLARIKAAREAEQAIRKKQPAKRKQKKTSGRT